jgi:hypothetical protein
MTNQNDLEEEYPPEIQAVIDRFISGEIELKNKPPVDPVDCRLVLKFGVGKWHNSHESAEKALNDRKKYGSWR